MLLGSKTLGAGNKTRCVVDYSNWLDDGDVLTAQSVTLAPQTPPITDIVISGVGLTASKHLVFFISGGSANEVFTLNIQITTNRTEIKNDTAQFTVVAP